MRWRFFLAVLFLSVAGSAHAAKELIIPISAVAAGANGTLFRTDARVFNPSATQSITVQMQFLPLGLNGTSLPGRALTVAPRQMMVLDNIVGTFFILPQPALGAIRMTSDFDFVADSRTYTDSPNPAAPGTFGQFIPAVEPSRAVRKSVVLHLSNSSNLQAGFRTNAGATNPGLQEATVTPLLFNANGTLIRQGAPFTVPPRSVVQAGLPSVSGQPVLDFQDGYLVLDSTVPIFSYASVIDNRSADQIFVLGVEDIGPSVPAPTEKIVNITARQFEFNFSPNSNGAIRVKVGDRVKLRIRTEDVAHGFAIERYLTNPLTLPVNGSVVEVEFVADQAGSFLFFCTNTACGVGHLEMDGQLVVEP
jgi:hypothetical protein